MARLQVLRDGTTSTVTARFSRRPDSCTVAIYDAAGAELSAAAPVNPGAQLTFSNAGGLGQADPRLAILTDTAGLVFRGTYLAINADQSRESVTLLSIGDAGCITAERMQYAYAAGDTLESPAVARTLDATETADIGVNLRARFVATMPDATVETADVIFDVVLHTFEQPVTSRNLYQFEPTLKSKLPRDSRGTDWAAMLDRSWDAVYQDFVTQGIRAQLYMDPERLRELHLYKFKLQLCESGVKLGEEDFPFQAARYFAAQYQALLPDVASRAAWHDHSADLAPSTAETEPIENCRSL